MSLNVINSRLGFDKVAELLLNNGADTTIKNNNGKTPKDLAVDNSKIIRFTSEFTKFNFG